MNGPLGTLASVVLPAFRSGRRAERSCGSSIRTRRTHGSSCWRHGSARGMRSSRMAERRRVSRQRHSLHPLRATGRAPDPARCRSRVQRRIVLPCPRRQGRLCGSARPIGRRLAHPSRMLPRRLRRNHGRRSRGWSIGVRRVVSASRCNWSQPQRRLGLSCRPVTRRCRWRRLCSLPARPRRPSRASPIWPRSRQSRRGLRCPGSRLQRSRHPRRTFRPHAPHLIAWLRPGRPVRVWRSSGVQPSPWPQRLSDAPPERSPTRGARRRPASRPRRAAPVNGRACPLRGPRHRCG